MKRLNSIMISGILFIPSLAGATLAPYWERVKELKAILDSSEVHEKANFHPIESIEVSKTNPDKYILKTSDPGMPGKIGSCEIQVLLETKKAHRPDWTGPRQFGLRVSERGCKES